MPIALCVSCSLKTPAKKTVPVPPPPTREKTSQTDEYFKDRQSEIAERFKKIEQLKKIRHGTDLAKVPTVKNKWLKNRVRIGLSRKKDSFQIYSTGSVEFHEKNGNMTKKIQTLRGRFLVHIRDSLIDITVPGDSRPLGASSGILQIISQNSFNLIELDKRAYRGTMEIRRSPRGGLRAINLVNLEDYLRGVVPNEMPAKDPSILEALKAQAVAARTYAMTHLNQFPDLGFDMFSDERDQVYKGANTEQYFSDKAVAETAGLLLSFEGQLAKCFYHSTCGGATANINEVWRNKPIPYLHSQSDKDKHKVNYCHKSGYTHWFESWKRAQLADIIKANLEGASADKKLDFTTLLNLKVETQTKSGRVGTLQITTDKGIIRVKGDKTRWVLRRKTPDGPILFSSWFTIVKFGPEVLVRGRGFGHGIGMCQYGAMGRARTGKAFYEILLAYYKGTKLVKMNLE